MSKWKDHQAKWKNCTACHLAETRKRVVLARWSLQQLPCDVLFVGEAPGTSEEVIGKAFIGPAGKLLDSMIADAGMDVYKLAWTNLIACFPRDDDGRKAIAPPEECIKACSPRLSEFVELAKPGLVVAVGSLADKWVDGTMPYCNKPTSIIHPAAILRMDISQKGLAIQRTIVTLRDALENLVQGE